MPHPVSTTVTLAAAVANGIATSQALPGASGLNLVLNGSKVTAGVAILDSPRRIIITSAGNDSGITFTITGTRGSWWAQQTISETITGGNNGVGGGVASSTQDFLTVTSIVASGATASTVTAGTSGTGSGPWVIWDAFVRDFQVSVFGSVLSGAPTWQVDYTYDDVTGFWLPPGVTFPRVLTLGTMTGLAGTFDESFTSKIFASRLTLTAVGSVNLLQQQQGAV